MRKPSLSANVVKGLFKVSCHADAISTDFPEDKYLGQACEYLTLLIGWYQSKHPDFDILDGPDWEAETEDDYDMVPDDDFTSGGDE